MQNEQAQVISDYSERKELEIAHGKTFYDAALPHFPLGFSIHNRNPGHWDIVAKQVPGRVSAWKAANPEGSTIETDGANERAFCIRGEPGNVVVRDERWNPHNPSPDPLKFPDVATAMAWICTELMKEPTSGG